jgi:hypothetical protein
LGFARWTGKVHIWYGLVGSQIRWYYDMNAVEHPGGRTLRRTSTAGAAVASRVGLLCHPPARE